MSNLERWGMLWQKLGVHSQPESVLERLLRAYAEPHRAYHTFEHIGACLFEFDQAHELAEHPVAVEAALWMHDVVYDPHAHDNEARSAEWATEVLRTGQVAEDTIDRVQVLILATQHKIIPTDADAKLIVDIDLSILGRAEAEFDRYEAQVRQEYEWVPEATFRAARAQILESFLARASIYYTAPFQERYETQARENLKRSIQKLHDTTFEPHRH